MAPSPTDTPLPPRDPRQGDTFDPLGEARSLLRSIRIGALGTLVPARGFPLTTLTTIATDYDGTPVILVSGLSHHTRNLAADPRCSVLLARQGKGDPLAHPRLSLLAIAQESADPHLRRRFLARHPKARLYVDFPDFTFYRLVAQQFHLNGGFARAFDGAGASLQTPVPDRAAFADLEAAAMAHLNADHAETIALYATQLCAKKGGGWRISGIDPDGVDLICKDETARIDFAEPVFEAGALHNALKALAHAARRRQNGD